MDMHSMSMQAMTNSMHYISDGQTAAGIIVTGLIAFAFLGWLQRCSCALRVPRQKRSTRGKQALKAMMLFRNLLFGFQACK